jgi:4a-hydroxytetrahydrobiopterin dehydratase
VSELAHGHCETCTPGTPPLPEPEAAELSEQVPNWEREGTSALRREFTFANFRDAFGFVARVALIAEAEGHHPDIELGWGRAAFELSTHAASGLTRNDFVLAAKIDRLAGCPDRAALARAVEADEGTRTPDPLLTMEVLYQLSYVGAVADAQPSAAAAGAGARLVRLLAAPSVALASARAGTAAAAGIAR